MVREITGGVTYTKFQRQAEIVYEAVSFYKEKLKREKNKSELAEKLELVAILGLGILGSITIVSSF